MLINKTARPQSVTLDATLGAGASAGGSGTNATAALVVTIVDAEGEREHTLGPGETLLELPPFAVAFAAVPER